MTNDRDPGVRETAILALTGAVTGHDARAALMRCAADDPVGRIRQAAVPALAELAWTDSQVSALMLELATGDVDSGVRLAALQVLASAVVADPLIRALLLDRLQPDAKLEVGSADWAGLLPGERTDPVVNFIVAGVTREADRHWLTQLAVRIAACSARFDPAALPEIDLQQGALTGYIIGV